MTPDISAAFENARSLTAAGQFAEAAPIWLTVAEAEPENPDAWNNLGVTLAELGRYQEAEAAMRAGLALQPAAAYLHRNLAHFLHLIGRWEEALAVYRTAFQLTDDLRLRCNLAHALLGLGHYEEGWRLYGARTGLPVFAGRILDPNEWGGEPLAGREIQIWPEQGFGDQIQFARFATSLVARGARVTMITNPPLCDLFAMLGPEIRIVEWRPDLQMPPYDFWVSVGSLPLGLGVGLGDLSGKAYLSVPPERRERWAGHAGKGAIGYAWRGSPTHHNDKNRSLSSPDALLEVLGATGAPLVDLTNPRGDFADLAAVIEQLDLVVTVDTAVAHLTGALGVPCWVLLPGYEQDWRWLKGRDDSPWYDSVRLFRQPALGDWDAVMADLQRALKSRVKGRRDG